MKTITAAMQQTEKTIQREIIKWLTLQKVFHWRHNNLAVYDAKRDCYRSFVGMKGVPDICCLVNGKFIGIEVKGPSGKQSEEQRIFKEKIEKLGHIYVLAHSLSKVIDFFIKNPSYLPTNKNADTVKG